MSTKLLHTSREEFDGKMNIIDGSLPKDLTGVFYASYPVGSVNSGGLPFPAQLANGDHNPEYGSPIMNGDGMVLMIDFNQSEPAIKQRLMKTPCFYADLNSRVDTDAEISVSGKTIKDKAIHELFGFRNFGISRISPVLGARNELNTAIIPVRFGDDEDITMMSTYDVGRPFLVDSSSLELLTPIGTSDEYIGTQPGFVPWPFGVQETTAHPCYDPGTREMFLVNYTRDSKSFMADQNTIYHLQNNREKFQDKLLEIAENLFKKGDKGKARKKISHFFSNLHAVISGDKWEELENSYENKWASVYLMKWNGEDKLDKWLLKDQDGNPLKIVECMHQMGMSKDYIILTDCSFKFSMDIMVNNPFPNHPKIDEFIRWMLSTPMEPFTTTYIVKRADLKSDVQEVVATKLDKPIPVETIHYSTDYDNPDNKVTLYGIHNSAVCVAEWLRAYDTELLSGNHIDPDVISLFAIGSMDLSRFGKWVIDAENGKLLEEESTEYIEKGNVDSDDIGPNSWSIGLYAHRDLVSADKAPNKVESVWFVANGTDPRMLSKFIYDLYKDYPNRILETEEIKRCTDLNLPFGIVRVDTDTMKAGDYYQCPKNTYVRSIQFANRVGGKGKVPLALDGYLICTVQVGKGENNNIDYTSEIWIFDAADVSKGPICKMNNPQMQFCFTLHSSWIPKAAKSPMKYHVNIEEDYNQIIDSLIDKEVIKPYFEKYVYPNFK